MRHLRHHHYPLWRLSEETANTNTAAAAAGEQHVGIIFPGSFPCPLFDSLLHKRGGGGRQTLPSQHVYDRADEDAA